jgi:hypothetical protein
MADFYSDIAEAQNTAASQFGNAAPTPGLVSGELQFARATVTLAGTETASDTIYLVKLPKGARVIPHLCNIVCDDPGTTLTGNVGDAADPDRYGSAIALGVGGSFSLDELLTAPKADYKVGDAATDDGWIIFDPTTVDTLTANAKVIFTIVFSMT